jgi:hypothetical protein
MVKMTYEKFTATIRTLVRYIQEENEGSRVAGTKAHALIKGLFDWYKKEHKDD